MDRTWRFLRNSLKITHNFYANRLSILRKMVKQKICKKMIRKTTLRDVLRTIEYFDNQTQQKLITELQNKTKIYSNLLTVRNSMKQYRNKEIDTTTDTHKHKNIQKSTHLLDLLMKLWKTSLKVSSCLLL